MSEKETSGLEFLRYSTPGYLTYLYFVLLILPFLHEANVRFDDWKIIVGIIFGGIPIGGSLGYITYSFYDSAISPYGMENFFNKKSETHRYLRKKIEVLNINKKYNKKIIEAIIDYSHIKKSLTKDKDKEKEIIISSLRRKWAIFHNHLVVAIFSPSVAIIISILLITFFLQGEIINANPLTIIVNYNWYYIYLSIIIVSFSLLMFCDALKKFEEVDFIELNALLDNKKNIEDMLRDLKDYERLLKRKKREIFNCNDYINPKSQIQILQNKPKIPIL